MAIGLKATQHVKEGARRGGSIGLGAGAGCLLPRVCLEWSRAATVLVKRNENVSDCLTLLLDLDAKFLGDPLLNFLLFMIPMKKVLLGNRQSDWYKL